MIIKKQIFGCYFKNLADLEKHIFKANIKISNHTNMFHDFTRLQCSLGL